MTVPPYFYTGATEKVFFALEPFETDPPNCDAMYSCSLALGPPVALDICNVTDGSTEGIFDSLTGAYEF